METGMINKHITINAADYEVWDVLVKEQHTRKWASAFDEGVTVDSDWLEGSEVNWKDKTGKVIARGKVTANVIYKKLSVLYYDDTEEQQAAAPGEYSETYTLKKQGDDVTVLAAEIGPLNPEELMQHGVMWDAALSQIRTIAEEGE